MTAIKGILTLVLDVGTDLSLSLKLNPNPHPDLDTREAGSGLLIWGGLKAVPYCLPCLLLECFLFELFCRSGDLAFGSKILVGVDERPSIQRMIKAESSETDGVSECVIVYVCVCPCCTAVDGWIVVV
jgi:hypothetical protein